MQRKRRHVVRAFAALSFTLIAACGAVAVSWGAPPEIASIHFPANLPLNTTASGQILYRDPDRDVISARFDVVDGRYYRIQTEVHDPDGMSFSLACTSYPQQITLAVTLLDVAGERSEPKRLTFTCGQPPLYDFDSQQRIVLPVRQSIPLNFFLVDDGQTALTEGAMLSRDGQLAQPQGDVMRAITQEVLPKLTGIWDQCGVGFELSGAWVVNPARVQLAGGVDLATQLFQKEGPDLVIQHGAASGNVLRQAALMLQQAARAEQPRAAQAFNVFIVGARILTLWERQLTDIEGFSESGWPNYAIVRWGAILEGVAPKQMISTLAHELGHNLGLGHPGEDGLAETSSDEFNLMKGSGVTPQPRAHLMASQCRRAEQALAQLQVQLAAQANPPVNPPVTPDSTATVRWLSLCDEENVCRGKVSLSVSAEGFIDLQSFGFAVFEYSTDGKHFVEIGVDRTPPDGFATVWDTLKLSNGRYTLRATVIDARGVRASVLAEVKVQN
jgi:hypothetical protein